jgi:methyl-accepting chemotaxis protein
MLKNVKIGVKMIGSFIIVVMLVVAVGIVSMIGIDQLDGHIEEIGNVRLPSVESLLVMESEIKDIRGSLRTLLSPRLVQSDRDRQYRNIDTAREVYREAMAVYEPLPQTAEEAVVWQESLKYMDELLALNNQVAALSREIDATDILNPDAFEARMLGFINDHHLLMEQVTFLLLNGTEFSGGDDPTKCNFGKYIQSFETDNSVLEEALEEITTYHDAFHFSVPLMKEALAAGDTGGAVDVFQNQMVPNAEKTFELLGVMRDEASRVVGLYNSMNQLALVEAAETQRTFFSKLAEVIHINDTISADRVDLAISDSARVNTMALIGMVAAAALALILGIALTRAITGPMEQGVDFAKAISLGDLGVELKVEQKDEIGQLADAMREMQQALQIKARVLEQIAEGDLSVSVQKASEKDGLGESMVRMKSSLNDLIGQVRSAVEQVTAGADQVSQASQNLSQGATEQASSLEEVSSSATQVNSQSKQNAENATEANSLSKKAAQDAESGNKQMAELEEAMKKINTSSDEIKKVVKVIDDIAFQINLLALNANVEAARAGKYGKGFAVVAEEVRNLAVRSANAVQETTGMVEDSIRNIELGNKAVELTGGQLRSIVDGAGKVANFLDEIATASREQAQAIEQISEGLDQIDQVTQSNTASAEESASASEELAGQAQQLQGVVSQFILEEQGGRPVAAAALPAPQENWDEEYDG